MALKTSAIRQRIAAQISTSLGGDGWNESRYVHDLFGSDTDHIGPKAYSVGIRSSELVGNQRLRPADGAHVATEVEVVFSWRIRGDAQKADYDAALDAENDLVKAVLATDRTDLSSLILDGIPARQVDDTGTWFIGTLRFGATHMYALQ